MWSRQDLTVVWARLVTVETDHLSGAFAAFQKNNVTFKAHRVRLLSFVNLS